jgi:hypothetical protein
MPELLDGCDGSIRDEKPSNVGPAGIGIAHHGLEEEDSHTYGYTRGTFII